VEASWSRIEDGDRVRSKQAEMLGIDERFAGEWVATMRELFEQELSDVDHTAARMAALKDWTRRRSLAAHRLNYKYDPARRKARLIERDTERQLGAMKEKLHTLGQRFEQQQAARPASAAPTERPVVATAAAEQRPGEQTPAVEGATGSGGVWGSGIEPINDGPRGLLEIDDKFLYAITRDTEIRNPIRATDTEIIEACLRKRVHPDTIRMYIAALN
jgi:hypothetical protein